MSCIPDSHIRISANEVKDLVTTKVYESMLWH